MKGLILKDFINLKKNARIFGTMTVLYAVMAMFSNDANFFGSIFMMLIAILTLSLYSYDELARWDSFALTMPISRDDIVQGKYIMMLLLTIIGAAYSSIFTVIINIIVKADSVFNGFSSISVGAAIVIFFYSVTLPFITKLGVEKARLIFFAIYIIPFIAVISLKRLINDGSLVITEDMIRMAKFFMNNVYLIVPLVDLVAIGISYWISVSIFRKKEF